MVTRQRHSVPSVQTAISLGRVVQHEDTQPVSVQRFAANICQNRGWDVPNEKAEGEVIARIDTGRWVADCPLGCGGAEMVSVHAPFFTCLSCGSGGLWWPVVFPSNREAIEKELLKRRDVRSWSWNPDESVAVLRRQTKKLAGK